MVSTRKEKGRNKKQFSLLDDTLNDFVIVNGTTFDSMGNEDLKSQAHGHYDDLEKIIDGASGIEVIGCITDDRIRNSVDSAVIAVRTCMHDASLTALNNVIIPRVELAVGSITGSSGNEPNSIVQNLDQSIKETSHAIPKILRVVRPLAN